MHNPENVVALILYLEELDNPAYLAGVLTRLRTGDIEENPRISSMLADINGDTLRDIKHFLNKPKEFDYIMLAGVSANSSYSFSKMLKGVSDSISSTFSEKEIEECNAALHKMYEDTNSPRVNDANHIVILMETLIVSCYMSRDPLWLWIHLEVGISEYTRTEIINMIALHILYNFVLRT